PAYSSSAGNLFVNIYLHVSRGKAQPPVDRRPARAYQCRIRPASLQTNQPYHKNSANHCSGLVCPCEGLACRKADIRGPLDQQSRFARQSLDELRHARTRVDFRPAPTACTNEKWWGE